MTLKKLARIVGSLCLVALTILAASAAAQDGNGMDVGTLSVEVVATDGSDVAGTVILFDGDSPIPVVLESKDKGKITKELRAGRWDIYVTKKGYDQVSPKPKQIRVQAGPDNDEQIEMANSHARVRTGRDNPRIVLVLYRRKEQYTSNTQADPVCKAAANAQAGGPGKISLSAQVVSALSSPDPQNNGAQQPLRRARAYLFKLSPEAGGQEVIGQAKSDSKGCFTFSFDAPESESKDNYLFSVSLNGYKSHVALLSVQELKERAKSLQLIQLELNPERPPESSEESSLTRKEAALRYVFVPRVMEALPVPGTRSFDSFALLAPGVLPPPQTPNPPGPGVSPGVGTAGQFAVNGLRSRENNFTVDGSDNNDEDIGTRRQGFVALAPQAIESLLEFQIVTALGDANYGRDIGGQVNALTKSGTSQFHGSFYGFLNDSRLNARGPFDQVTRGNPSSSELRRESDGAPVLLDGHPIVTPDPVGGKNPFTRTIAGFVVGGPADFIDSFFFASLERVKTRASRESHFIVPTVEERGLFDSGGTGLLLNGRRSGPLPLFPASVPGDAVFSLYPFPNDPLGPFGRNTYTAVLPADADATRLSGKLEHQFGVPNPDKAKRPWHFFNGGDTLTGRYNFTQDTSIVPVTGGALFSSLRPRVRTQNLAFFLDRTFTKRFSDAVRVSFGRTKLSFRAAPDPYLSPSTFFPGDQFLLNAPLLLNVTAPLPDGTLTQPRYITASSPQGAALLGARGYTGVTSVEQIAGPLGQVVVPGFSPIGVDVFNFPQARANNTFQYGDTFTYVASGGHILTFGTDVRKIQINSTLDRGFRPLAVFGGLRTSAPSPNIDIQLPGSPSPQTQVFSPETLVAGGTPTGLFQTLAVNPTSNARIRFVEISFFQQTSWRAAKNLNINLGARLNYLTRLHTKGKTLENAFDLNRLQAEAAAAVDGCAASHGLRQDCENFANAIVSAFPGDFKASFEGDKLDLDARTGFAWTLDDRTVVRGGFGTYSGELPGIVLSQSRNAFPNFLPLNFANFPLFQSDQSGTRSFLFNPANPLLRQIDPTLAISPNSLNTLAPDVNAVSFLINRLVNANIDRPFSVDTLGLDLVLPQKALKTPYALQYGLTLERQFGRDYVISVAYVGTRGIKLLRVNTPDLGLGRSQMDETLPPTKLTSYNSDNFPDLDGFLAPPQEPIARAHLVIARTLFESSGSSSYNSLQVELRRRYARRFQFASSLTYSHSIDDVSDFFDTTGDFALPQNSLLRSERASSDFDIRLRSVSYFIYDMRRDWPFSTSSKLGGWQAAGIITAQSGQPFTVNSAFDINRDGNLTDRLDTTNGLIAGESGDGRTQLTIAPGFSPSALLAQNGQDGAVGRNTFRAPGLFNVDLAVTKFLNFGDRYRLQLRTEIFNLLNRADYGIPVRILESTAFGKSTYTTVSPRTVQFAAKFLF